MSFRWIGLPRSPRTPALETNESIVMSGGTSSRLLCRSVRPEPDTCGWGNTDTCSTSTSTLLAKRSFSAATTRSLTTGVARDAHERKTTSPTRTRTDATNISRRIDVVPSLLMLESLSGRHKGEREAKSAPRPMWEGGVSCRERASRAQLRDIKQCGCQAILSSTVSNRDVRERLRRMILILLLMAITSGCTARRPVLPGAAVPTPAPTPTEDLDALIQRGCFRCLEEAFVTAQARNAPQQAFEAAALLALRAKELGMRPDEWLERAQVLADGDGSWALVLDIVRAVPADPLSGDRDVLLATGPRGARLSATRGPDQTRALIPLWRQALEGGGGSAAFRAYVDLAVVCGFESGAQRDETVEKLSDKIPEIPLLQYRLGICGNPQGPRLLAVRTADADFVDADFPLARFELSKVENPDQE